MSRSVITATRDLTPMRSLSREEAFRIAELHATRFRTHLGIDTPYLPDDAMTSIPYIRVERVNSLPMSGGTQWRQGLWLVVLRGSEPRTRQRFSLAHELKHIIDHRFIDQLYERIPERERRRFVEQICDYFAGCLLMPRTALKKAWGARIQDPTRLAELFDVSVPAIETRLAQIGLSRGRDRCGVQNPAWTLPIRQSADSSSASYNRPAHPLWTMGTLTGALL